LDKKTSSPQEEGGAVENPASFIETMMREAYQPVAGCKNGGGKDAISL
jgi:hypothetical protein